MWQVEAEEMNLLLDTPDHRHGFTEIGLGVAGRMGERHEHLLGAGLPLAQIVLHDRVAAGKAVLGTEAFVDPLGRMPLLGRR
jgi:hypothetical protein